MQPCCRLSFLRLYSFPNAPKLKLKSPFNLHIYIVTFLGLRRVHFSFSTCLLSISHHMTNHPSISITWPITWPPTWPITCHSSHLLLKVTCPISPAPKSPAHHLILPHLTSHDPIPTLDSSLFTYLSLASGFSARLLYFLHSLVSRLITDSFLVTFTRESVPQYMTPSFGLWLVTSTSTRRIMP